MALVDSGALHCFVSEMLVARFELPVLPGDGMEVTLADSNQVEVSKTRLVPLVVCTVHYQALHCVVKCQVSPRLNHDTVLVLNWLQVTNPVIDW